MSQSKLTSEQYQLLLKIASGLRNYTINYPESNLWADIWGEDRYAFWRVPGNGRLDRALTEKGKQALAEWQNDQKEETETAE